MTSAEDRTAVGEALAVGCLATNVTAIAANPMSVERAFRRAWAHWRGASRYPTIRADFERNNIQSILIASERRNVPHIAAWSDKKHGWWTPYLTVPWEIREAAEHLHESDGPPWDSWTALIDAFLGELTTVEVRRTST